MSDSLLRTFLWVTHYCLYLYCCSYMLFDVVHKLYYTLCLSLQKINDASNREREYSKNTSISWQVLGEWKHKTRLCWLHKSFLSLIFFSVLAHHFVYFINTCSHRPRPPCPPLPLHTHTHGWVPPSFLTFTKISSGAKILLRRLASRSN